LLRTDLCIVATHCHTKVRITSNFRGNHVATQKFPIKKLSEMFDSSIKNLGKSNMTTKTNYNIKKPRLGRKIGSQGRKIENRNSKIKIQYIKRSVTKSFPIKILFEMIDSSIKVEFDRQNHLQLHRTQVW